MLKIDRIDAIKAKSKKMSMLKVIERRYKVVHKVSTIEHIKKSIEKYLNGTISRFALFPIVRGGGIKNFEIVEWAFANGFMNLDRVPTNVVDLTYEKLYNFININKIDFQFKSVCLPVKNPREKIFRDLLVSKGFSCKTPIRIRSITRISHYENTIEILKLYALFVLFYKN